LAGKEKNSFSPFVFDTKERKGQDQSEAMTRSPAALSIPASIGYNELYCIIANSTSALAFAGRLVERHCISPSVSYQLSGLPKAREKSLIACWAPTLAYRNFFSNKWIGNGELSFVSFLCVVGKEKNLFILLSVKSH
jgi:hypothetical protein